MSHTDERDTWTLPLDIFMEVMSISQPVAAGLMATCRLLHELGPLYVFRHGVFLRKRSQMVSFVSFMHADGVRVAYLQFLHLEAGVFAPLHDGQVDATNAAFAKLLTHPGIALDTLNLNDMEKMLACNPPLLTAVGALRTLKRLCAHGVGRAALDALRTMRSKLVATAVVLMGPLGYTPALHVQSAFSDVFSVLRLSADTLQELTLYLGTPINPLRDIPVYFWFPRVHTLRTVLDTHFPQCILLRLFPNLRYLYLFPGQGSFNIMVDPNVVWFMTSLRDTNKKIGLSPSLRLLECSGEVTSLYPLSAHLTASKLRICGYPGTHELPFLRGVLADVRPAELELSVYGLKVAEEVASILRELGPRTLRVLTLSVSFQPEDGDQVAAEKRLQAALDILLRTGSVLKIVVNVPSRSPVVLNGSCPLSSENLPLDFLPVPPSSSSRVLGAETADAQRLDLRIAPQEA